MFMPGRILHIFAFSSKTVSFNRKWRNGTTCDLYAGWSCDIVIKNVQKFIFPFDRIAIWCHHHKRKSKYGRHVRMLSVEWLTCIWRATVWRHASMPDRVCPIPTEILCHSDCLTPCTDSKNPRQTEWTKFRNLCTRSDAMLMWTNHRVWLHCCRSIGQVSNRR